MTVLMVASCWRIALMTVLMVASCGRIALMTALMVASWLEDYFNGSLNGS